MRVFLTSQSRYPASQGGFAGSRVQDNIAKGLAELGHLVHYCVAEGYAAPLPRGVVASRRDAWGADIYHFYDYPVYGLPPQPGKPWVHTYHAPYEGDFAPEVAAHFIYVSRAQAERYGSPRYVWNGIDPDEVVYSETKEDYFLFVVTHLKRAEVKGLHVAISVVERLGARLLVAADPGRELTRPELVSPNVTYVGFVGGQRKAELLAGAKALLFPVQGPETFGLPIAEALMSGTPVIGSRNGSVPELVTPDAGFTCDTVDDYAAAAARIGEISPAACRARAMTEFHYRVMAERYLAEYEHEISSA